MWIVAFMCLGASCSFFDDGLCELYRFSLGSFFWIILGILFTIIFVMIGVHMIEDKFDKEIDVVSGFAISFVLFWSAYGMFVRIFPPDILPP
jgi:hypothetical protein